MDHDRTRTRLRLLVTAAIAIGCFAASLSGTLSALAHARPFAEPLAQVESKEPDTRREVRTIGMMMAEHSPV